MTIVATNICDSSNNGVFINRRRDYDLRVTVGVGWLTMQCRFRWVVVLKLHGRHFDDDLFVV